MATYELTTPDGKVYEIEAPITNEVILASSTKSEERVPVAAPTPERMEKLARDAVSGKAKELKGWTVNVDDEVLGNTNFTDKIVSVPREAGTVKHELGHILEGYKESPVTPSMEWLGRQDKSSAYIDPDSVRYTNAIVPNGVLRTKEDLYGTFAAGIKGKTGRNLAEELYLFTGLPVNHEQTVIWTKFIEETKDSKTLEKFFDKIVWPSIKHRVKSSEIEADYIANPIDTIKRLNLFLKYEDPTKRATQK